MKTVYFLLSVVMVFVSTVVSAQTTLKGKVISPSTKEKLSGAFVSCISGKKTANTITESDGEFKFKNLVPGQYDLKIEYVGYENVTIHVTLTENRTTELTISMEKTTKELTDVLVFGKISQEEDAGARQKEKRAGNIVNVISAKAMERSPDINAANVLQRMSGLTIQRNGGGDEAYPIIRGLDPRYNNTLINGVKIASPDEKSRFVPLSIVPSDLLGSIEVHKSLLPEMEGDAIGGTVNMVMKDAPEKKIFKVLGSLGYSKIFMDRTFDNFSKADIRSKSPIEKNGLSYIARPDDFSRSNLDFKEIRPIPTSTFSIVAGKRFMKNKMGLMVAGNYQNQYYGSNSVLNQAVNDPSTRQPALSDYANRRFSTQQMNSGLVFHLDYNLNDRNKITLTNVLLYSYLAQARVITDTALIGGNGGRTVPGTGPVSTDYTSVTSKQYIENVKLEGKHILSKHFLFDWAGVYSLATKRTPDFADISVNKKIDTVHTNSDIHGPYTFVTTPDYFDVITRTWQHNKDQDINALGNLSYRSKLGNSGSLELKAGGLYRHKTRYNLQDTYELQPLATGSNGTKQIYSGINNAQWTVYNSSGTYDYDKNKYNLYENVTAGYGEFKLSLPFIDVFGGVREEVTSQGYTFKYSYPTASNGLKKEYTDLLPSGMVKIKLDNKTNLRASYFKSISRPNYYELVPSNISSVSNATITTGNPELRHTVADNYDIRYEFFPKEEEQFFAGAFYKTIKDPIEYAYLNGTTFKPRNFGNATVYGGEIQFTKYFGNIGVTGNYTYLHSKISSPKTYNDFVNQRSFDSLQSRPMQGQTDHTLNISLLYRNDKGGLYLQLAYEYIGKTLGLVYNVYGYDYYQQPQSLLAFSGEKQLSNRHFTVFTKFNNLLNTHTRSAINTLRVLDETTKFNFSFGLRYSR
ncbi:TonB-dependent receptor [Flavitalea flava]